MKKKITLVIMFIMIFSLKINTVAAASFSDTSKPICGFDYAPSRLPNFTSGLYNIVKLMVPIILIIMGMIDFAGAVMAQDEKKMQASQKKFITRLIAGVIVFFVMAIVQFVFNKIDAGTDYKNGFSNCINCLLNGNESACGAGTTDLRKQCSDYGYSCPPKDENGHRCYMKSEGVCAVKYRACSEYDVKKCPDQAENKEKCQKYNNKCQKKCSSLGLDSCMTNSSCEWNGQTSQCVNK